jgi:hypothetical protein
VKNGLAPITSPPTRQLHQFCEDLIEIALGAGVEDMELQTEGVGCRLQVSCRCLGISGIGRIDEDRHDGHRGKKLVQQFQPLRRYHHVQLGYARDVAARSVKAGDESKSNWVAA